MKKRAILIPGVGYTTDRPLLYYAGKIAASYGFTVQPVSFHNLPPFDKDTKEARLACFQEALKQAEDALREVAWEEDAQTLFISKSLGTVIAARIAEELRRLHDVRSTHIYFTPVEQTFLYAANGSGIAFAGTADPLADIGMVRRFCHDKQIPLHVAEGGNHSLETGDTIADLKTVYYLLQQVDGFLSGLSESLYDLRVLHPERGTVPLSEYRGQVLLIVNTATGCGFTPQYEALERLYRAYHKDGFCVLDFPCNQFGRQAPGTDAEIHSFCTSRYDISYPQFSKIHVNGDRESELYTFLKKRQSFKGFDLSTKEGLFLHNKLKDADPDYAATPDIKWNFTKFLVDRDGSVVARYEPTDDLALLEDNVRKLLGK